MPKIAINGAVPLRPYQEECVQAVFEQFRENQSTLVLMPTGTGKTITFAGVCERWTNGRIVVMAHREELINQNADKIRRFAGLDCDIEMADRRADQSNVGCRAPVVVTSVQTMRRESRHSRFNPADFSLLVIDECHHSPSSSYRQVIEHFRQNPNLKILGVTATPDRLDKQALGRVFQTVAYDYSIVQAIDDGWLVPIEQQFVHVKGLDLSSVKVTAGDLNGKQLAEVLEQEEVLHGYAWPTIELAQGEKTLVFTERVNQAERLAEIFNRHKSGSARWICADQTRCSTDERRDAIKGFKNGDYQFLVNVGILLEGYDEPRIKVISIARPTISRTYYAQMIGRGTRPLTGLVDSLADAGARRLAIANSDKASILVLDFVGNSGRHKLIHTGDILGGNYDGELILDALKKVKVKSSAGLRSDMLKELRAAEERRVAVVALEELRATEERRLAVVAKSMYHTRPIDPFDPSDRDILAVSAACSPAHHVNGVEDEMTSAFFVAREHATYYRSLLYLEDRRAFHDQLRPVLLRLLRVTNESGTAFLDALITRPDNAEVVTKGYESPAACLWAVRRLLFEIALDQWRLDDAILHLEALTSDKQRCAESKGQRLIDLIEPTCKLTERLCATKSADKANSSLAVAQEGLRMAQARGLFYDPYVRQAEETVAGTHKPLFFLNDARQVENAFRLEAIDEKRYEVTLSRLAGQKRKKEADRSERRACLADTNFLASLPTDAQLKPSHNVAPFVPQPGYDEYRAENLTPDQQAEYIKAFRDGDNLDLVAKYTWVRLSSLLRSAILWVGCCDLGSLVAEVETLGRLQPRCDFYAKGVRDVLGFLSALSHSRQADYAAQLAMLLDSWANAHLLLYHELSGTFFDSARELASKYNAAGQHE